MPKVRHNLCGTKWTFRSFGLNQEDERMLTFLKTFYGINRSALMRKLINEAYNICKLLPAPESME